MPTELRKAAILLTSLPEDQAAQLLAKLNPKQVEAVTIQIAKLGRLTPDEQESVLREFGESNPNWDILRQVELYRSGVLKLDEVITKTYKLDQIAQGYQDMHDGKNQKGVVVFD